MWFTGLKFGLVLLRLEYSVIRILQEKQNTKDEVLFPSKLWNGYRKGLFTGGNVVAKVGNAEGL